MDEWIDLMLWKQIQRDRKKKCPFHHMVEKRILKVQCVLHFFRRIIDRK